MNELKIQIPSRLPPAAAAVWNVPLEDTAAALLRLLNLSLIKVNPGPHERYRLHDLLDEYATDKLAVSIVEDETRRRMAEWLVELFDEHNLGDLSTAPQVF